MILDPLVNNQPRNAQQPPLIARVWLATPLRRGFDYLLPPELAEKAVAGARVRVPFGRGQRIGLLGQIGVEAAVALDKLKPIAELLDSEPVLSPALSRLVHWAADYYLHSLGDAWQQALPVLIRKGAELHGASKAWQLTEQGLATEESSFGRAVKQRSAWHALQQGPLEPEALAQKAIQRSHLKALADKGLAEEISIQEDHVPFWQLPGPYDNEGPRLNTEQAVAVAALNQAEGFQPFLLNGVTGAGKTEVYLQAMAPVLNAGKQVLVLVPEIGLTPQTLARFERRFTVPMVVLHSAMTDLERLKAWRLARSGAAAIIIGTRSAVFTPMARPGLIVVDEEHDASFKQQEGFRYHGRDLAVMRAHLEKLPIVLGSATPSLESLANVAQDKYRELTLSQRAGGALPVRQLVVDLKHQPLQGGLSPAVQQLMAKHLDRGEQVLVFLNRRGYAPALLCHECGWLAACHRCSAYPTVHQGSQKLTCHHCGSEGPLPRQCQQCGSSQLLGVGLGTEQLESQLRERFPEHPLVRIDRDATRRKGSLEKSLTDIRDGKYRLLVGTQMLAKGHHFPDVTLVVLVDVDGALYASDFRAAERLAQLFVQVSGRAGRASKAGTLVLQSHHPEHPLLQTLIAGGYGDFATEALAERQQTLLPPFSAQALLRAEAHQGDDAQGFLAQAAELLKASAPEQGWVMGPIPAPLERRAGKFRFQLLLQHEARQPLRHWLARQLPALEQLPLARRVNWSLDMDPIDMA
ncbi:primosomal protein N' [Gallaecimonas sp. GXIMD4217]|uniref:primosomal protein N' n=1 Tax=Gallaecimonas sp. GXIMD4217 TaxID=3131927 RepID=UPI00311B04FF